MNYTHKNIILILILFPIVSFSQKNLRINYNLTASGKNISLTIGKVKKNENELGFGLRYNINSLKHPDDQFNVFYRRLYATKPLHYIGLEGYYHKRIIKNWKTVKPFLFYNLQLSYSTTRSRSFLPFTIANDGDILYKEHIKFNGPYTWLEQSVGIGYNADLNDNFFITSKFGFEVMILNGKDDSIGVIEKYIREFGYIFSFSVGYRFQTKVKKKI